MIIWTYLNKGNVKVLIRDLCFFVWYQKYSTSPELILGWVSNCILQKIMSINKIYH